MKYSAAVITILAFVYAAAGPSPAAYADDPVRIAAAANLSGVMDALNAHFSAEHPDVTLEVITGSSGKLAAQIMNGAPFDIFLSADMNAPRKVAEAGLAVGTPVAYAQGRLVMFTTRDIDISDGLSVVASSAVLTISLANPALAPYGKAAEEALTAAGVYDRVSGKVIMANSIAEVVTQTVHGADVGFTALSLMTAPALNGRNAQGRNWVEVDDALYQPILQGMVLLSRAATSPGAGAFFAYMRSPAAKAILREYGYK